MTGAGARLDVDGTRNLRDLGGYATAGGAVVRRGRLFRSDHLGNVSDAGVAALAALGLRTVVDLRTADERARLVGRRPHGAALVEVDAIGGAGAAPGGLVNEVLAGRITRFTEADAEALYVEMVEGAPEMVATVLRIAASADRTPALFHCNAGKDRTGVVAALVLRCLGVADDVVEHDFARTAEYVTPGQMADAMRPTLESLGLDVEEFRVFFAPPAGALRAVLAWVDERGGTEAYLRDRCGITVRELAAVRANLLDAPGSVD